MHVMRTDVNVFSIFSEKQDNHEVHVFPGFGLTWDSNPHYRMHSSDRLCIHTRSSKLLHVIILQLKALFE